MRGLGTAVMHGTTLAILAAIAHEFAERETREAAGDFDFNLLWFVPGYLVAVALHTAFNQFPDRPLLAMMGAMVVAPLALMAIFSFGTAEAQRWLAAECAEHQRAARGAARRPLARGSSGTEDRRARRSGSMPKTAKRLRRYWELQAWLVAEAEETMMEEAAGDAEFDPAQVRAAFAELDGLQQGARAEHLHRAEGAAAVQPQRLLGSLGAAPAGRARQLSFSSCCAGRRQWPS